VGALVVNYRDVTEKMRSQEILRQSEERFRLIARATSDAIWDWDLSTDDTWFGDGMRALFGHALASPVTNLLWWLERIHPDERDRVEKGIRAAIDASDGRWEAEYRFLKADGSYANVFDRGFVVRNDEGRPIRMLGGMSDITARTRAEEERRLLDESFRMMADASTLGMSVFHRERIAYANAAFAEIFGYEAGEITGLSREQVINLIHPDDRELTRKRASARLRGEEQPSRVA
jgi:PAS domain S-box-containing protein